MQTIGRIIVLLWVLVLGISCTSQDPGEPSSFVAEDFTFISGDNQLSGVLDLPEDGQAKALIIFVHGYGPTDVRGWNMYSDLRQRFNALGITTATWDKPGLGKSEGEFDLNQPVAESADEVLDAIMYFREHNVPGADHIGIWGISRAGWIAPIAMAQDGHVDFWISVSGVTAEENYLYFVLSNLPFEGGTVEEARQIEKEWKDGFQVVRNGGSYEEYQRATPTVWANEYFTRMMGGPYSEEYYVRAQADYLTGEGPALDPETGLLLYVENFDEMLSGLNMDVLALFGEKDLNVDWRKTLALYQATIGENPDASLTVHTFPDGNHNIDVALTGSRREMEAMTSWTKADGYYVVQVEWLARQILSY